MSVYIPANLTAQELWYPHRKPSVPVKLNLRNPITRGLRNVLVLSPEFQLKGQTPPYSNGILDMPGGNGNRYNVFADVNWLKGRSEYTLCFGIKPRTIDGNNMVFAISRSSFFSEYDMMGVWIDNLDTYNSIENCVSFQHSVSGAIPDKTQQRVVTEPNSIIAGNYYNIVCRQNSSSADCYINGKISGIVRNTLISEIDDNTNMNEAFIGHVSVTITSSINGEIHYMYLFDRKLTDSEILSLNLNPYQIIEPI